MSPVHPAARCAPASGRRPRRARALRAALLGAVCAAAAAAGCTPGSAADGSATEAEPPRELVIFVYDRSTSIPDHALRRARELTNGRIDSLDHGDRIAAMQVLQLSLAEPPKRWSQHVPEREVRDHRVRSDSVSRARFLRDAKAYLASFADTAGREDIDGTDLLSTLHDVGAELRADSDRRATLYLFSDMLQSNRGIEMAGLRRMPPAGWIREHRARGMLPDLTGLCVVVVGARVDTERSQRVKSFWDEYFGATGATLLDRNYTLRPVRLPTRPCPGQA